MPHAGYNPPTVFEHLGGNRVASCGMSLVAELIGPYCILLGGAVAGLLYGWLARVK